MSHLDKQRVLGALSLQLFREEPLSQDQLKYLAEVFYRIANGEDANNVLEVRPRRGQKTSDAIAKRRMSLILHWVAGAIAPNPESKEKPFTIADACVLAMEHIVPVAKRMYPGADNFEYDAEYIARCWSEPSYQHMRSQDRNFFENDFPYARP
jgi:hypothetical protein